MAQFLDSGVLEASRVLQVCYSLVEESCFFSRERWSCLV